MKIKSAIKNILFIILFISFLFSCSNKSNLEQALDKNRTEIEKVLQHYSENLADSLKLKAAKFLIENMDAYSFSTSPKLEAYYHRLDSIFSLNDRADAISQQQQTLLNQLVMPNLRNFKIIPDLQYVSADFMIDNINRAFEAWESPFAKGMNFDDFCEYLLPYKFGMERPSAWRSAYQTAIYPHLKFMLDNSCRLDSGLILHTSQIALCGNDYQTLPKNIFDTIPDFTVSCWVNLSKHKPMARIFDFGTDGNYYICFIPHNNDKGATLEISTGANWEFIYTESLPLAQRSHVAMSYSKRSILLYVNGVLIKSLNVPLDNKKLVSNYIGKSHWDSDPTLNGKIEDFRIYDRELTYTEVRTLAGKDKELPDKRHELQAILWKIRDLYSPDIIYYNLFPGSYDPVKLLNMKKGSCYDYSVLGVYIFRSLGIPAGFDFVPQWANRSMGHSWNIIYSSNNRMEDYSFSALWEPLGSHLKSREEKVAKVFRRTYSKQPDAIAMNCEKKESLPELFQDTRIKDVTDLYLDCMDITIPLTQSSLNKQYAYLCNFNNRDWIPIHWGKTNEKEAVFTKMGKDVAYLPVYYDKKRVTPAADPFILTIEGEIKTLIPDHSKTQRLILTRKYYIDEILLSKVKLILGGKFQVANKVDFSDSLTVFTVNNMPEIRYNQVNLSLNKPYRYFRFLPPPSSVGNLAEMEIYSTESRMLSGNIIGQKNCEKGWEAENVFDGNSLTAYKCEWYETDCWIGLDFGKPTNISHFRYLSRNDDNFIKEGELYELFYWDNNQWNSLGKQTGTSKQYLEYINAPLNALFLLRNLTKGKEERIFTYENGKQIWW